MATVQKTVIIAEDDPATLQGLEKLLGSAGFRVMSYVDRETLRKSGFRDGVPCVLILGDIAGLDFLNFLKRSHWEIPVIFLHSGNSITEAVKAIQSGAQDYITKPFHPDTMLGSVRRAMLKAKRRVNAPQVNQELMSRATALTEREREVINLILSGMLNKQIAEQLKLALVTVKVHRGNAMRKLGARTAAELAQFARDAGVATTNARWQPNGHTTSSLRTQIHPSQSRRRIA